MEGTVYYLTPEGRERLEKELEHLRTVKRREVAHNLKVAIDEGDLRENAGYTESKRQQALVEGRILEIEAILAHAKIIDPAKPGGIVQLGSTVTIVENGGNPETYQIVGSAEADPFAGRISDVSPLGQALLGKRVGDDVQVETPGGTLQVRIIGLR